MDRAAEMNAIVQEKTLALHGVHTDDFNTLYDFIEAVATRIRENGK